MSAYACHFCGAALGAHHVACARYSGQVLPSEIPGYIDSVVETVTLRAEVARLKEQLARCDGHNERCGITQGRYLEIDAALAAVPAPAPYVIEVDGTLVPVDARGHALPRVPAPDAAPRDAHKRLEAHFMETLSPHWPEPGDRLASQKALNLVCSYLLGNTTPPLDLAAIIKERKP